MALLGPVVKRLSGQRYRDYVSTQILAPLGMRSTYWDARDVPKGRLATGYVRTAAGPTKVVPWSLGEMEPRAACSRRCAISHAMRPSSWRLTRRATIRTPPAAPQLRARGAHRRAPARPPGAAARVVARATVACFASVGGVGLGWRGFKSCDLEQAVGHMGAVDGYSAFIDLYPQRGFALVSLSNDHEAPHKSLIGQARDILLESAGLAPRARRASPALLRAIPALVNLYSDFREEAYRKSSRSCTSTQSRRQRPPATPRTSSK